MDYMAHQELMRLFTRYAGSCLKRWMLIKNQEVRNKEGARGTVNRIREQQNRILFSVNYHDGWTPKGPYGTKGYLFRDITYLALPSTARKELQKWIAIQAMNPDVKAQYSLPTRTESDIQLVNMWNPPIHNNLDGQSIIENYGQDWVLGRLLSARSAEKVAAEFYRNYRKTVRDISITQTDEKPQSDWRIYDLDVDGLSVDVKNSRESQHSKNRYSAYCIPQFKRNRENHEVTIAGVFSPYLWPCEILNPSEYSRDLKVRFLGETTRAKLEKLREEFNSLVEFRSDRPEFDSFLPPWVFEYPDYVYTERNKALKDCKHFSDIAKSTSIPLEWSLIPAVIASGTDLAMVLNHDALDHWERSFLNQLCNRIKKCGLSLPFVFLSVLEHFLDMASSSISDSKFDPDKYKRFLFCEDTDRPLGIYDPLSTIDALIKALATLWTAENGLIRKFRIFNLRSFNNLQGKSDQTDRLWTTLIAYCGGHLPEDGSACGKNPLILGESKLCDHRRLICPECGYCCDKCKLGIDGWTQ